MVGFIRFALPSEAPLLIEADSTRAGKPAAERVRFA